MLTDWLKTGRVKGAKKVDCFQQGGWLRFSGSYVKGFVNARAGRSGKTVVRLRDSLKTRWAGKSGYVNELVKNGAVRMGKSSSYSLETRRVEGKGSRVVMSD
jgi:hypothetical protein